MAVVDALLTCQKEQFNLTDDIAYLNCAYQSPLMKTAEDAAIKALQAKRNPSVIGVSDFYDPPRQVRELFSKLINSDDAERVAILPSVSYGIAQVAANLKIDTEHEILVAGEQFPSNYYSWSRLSEESGASLVVIEAPDSDTRGRDWNEAILEGINDKTAVVAIGNVHWADGTRFDLEQISKKVHHFGGKLIVDGTQSIGALPFDQQKIKADAVICAAYKWLLGPYSLALGYFGPDFDNGRPIEENWINRKDSDKFERLVNYESEYRPKAQRYNVGELSHFLQIPILIKSLEALLEWTPERIQEYTGVLLEPHINELEVIGCRIEESDYRGNHLFGIRLPSDVDPDTVKQRLSEENVFVSVRGDSVRVSIHLWNESKHMSMLVDALRKAVG